MTASNCLPDWALSRMDWWRNPPAPWVSIDEDLDHRREAFYRLYRADDFDAGAMWSELDEKLACDERAAFIHTVILATDEIVKNEPLKVYSIPNLPVRRLRTRVQRLARKFAEQVQLLAVCTPPRCAAHPVISRNSGVMVEALIIYFHIGQVCQDHDQRWRLTRLGVEYTTNSKRGWVQHRRASDVVRRKVIDVGRQLITEIESSGEHLRFAGELSRFVSSMDQLPDIKAEHDERLMLASQKSGYLDWFRHSYRATLSARKVSDQSPLSYRGWATLATIVTGECDISPDDIAHAVQAWRIL